MSTSFLALFSSHLIYIAIQIIKAFTVIVAAFGLTLVVRIIVRLRNEVFNSDIKAKPTSKQAIFITGATSGIGLALAKYFQSIGYTVIVGYFSSQEPGYEELRKINDRDTSGAKIYFVELNVRNLESISKSYDQVKDIIIQNGLGFRALINNAGLGDMQQAPWNNREKMRALVETNLLGPMFMVRQFLPLLAKTKGSRIVNVSSAMAMIPAKYFTIYGATKAGLAYYSAALQLEIRKYGVKVVTIFPANLIKNTSIVMTGTRDEIAVYSDFSKDDEEFCGQDLRDHITIVNKVRSRLARIKGSDVKVRTSLRSRISDFLSGAVDFRKNLEETKVMASFENAVRLTDPPLEMYSGSFCFNIIIGSFLELLSHFTRYQIPLCADLNL